MRVRLLVAIMLYAQLMNAQFDQVSMGTNYMNHVYYNLETGDTTQVANDSWDLAFDVFSQRDAGIFINEAVGSTMTDPLPELELYITDVTDFELEIDTSNIINRIHNPEKTWTEGAFNTVKQPGDPFDFGWGTYNPTTNTVIGDQVYIVKLRDNSYRKIQIQGLLDGAYKFRYANLDGSEVMEQELIRAEYEGKTLAFFSFASDSFLDLEPDAWDMLFTRYTTPLDDGEGNILQYIVTGVLIGPNTQVAIADEIDPATVDVVDYEDSFTDSVGVIGHDWKEFDLNTFQWSMATDRVYFVRTADTIWNVQFIDFEGGSTGTSTFEKAMVGSMVTDARTELKKLFAYTTYPNPASDHLTVAYEVASNIEESQLEIFNSQGVRVWNSQLDTRLGLNIKTVQVNFATGLYHVRLKLDSQYLTENVWVKP